MRIGLDRLGSAFQLLSLISYLLTFLACEPSVPARYIQPADFEDLLYDYSIALTMAEEGDSIDDRAAAWESLRLSVFDRHGVTEAQFDSSLVYYTRHADRLYKIYGSLQDRMSAEAVRWGADVRELNRYGDIAEDDTANIWPGERNIMLMHAAPYNFYTFHVEADTTFRRGDKMILSFDTRFLYQEGKKDCAVTLAVTFGNDSTASKTTHATRNGHFSLELADRDTLGIKEVKGYLCTVNDATAPRTTTMRHLFVNNIRLVRMETVKTDDILKAAKQERDTLKNDSTTADTVAVKKNILRPTLNDSNLVVTPATPLVKKKR